VVPGAGSAIFLHLAADDFTPTEGCVALKRPDFIEIIKSCGIETKICVLGDK
jgi:L,D-peptidoglycan transpeptidase YkuD (ErfK/YbiS/YcfS/YnhG family)